MNIPLFSPLVTKEMKSAVYIALGERIIGEGARVIEFEKLLSKKLKLKNIVAVNSGTSALELAYHLLELKENDEVITSVFSCTATNLPLVRRGVRVIFADVTDDLLLDWNDVKRKITKNTKAIINVHLFGKYNKAPHLSIPIIGDAAQYLGKTKGERFTIYSFQATKILTTVDGGALVCQRESDYKRAKLLRWYGADRKIGCLTGDIKESGYKYHMSNVTASMGIAALKMLDIWKKKIGILQKRYHNLIGGMGGSPYLIHASDKEKLIKKLALQGIEAGVVHKRNDVYSVFGGKRQNLSNMNRLEKTYLFLPCRSNMTLKEVNYICKFL